MILHQMLTIYFVFSPELLMSFTKFTFCIQLTGSLSDGLWSASSDSKSLESREAMKAERQHQSSGDHLVAGFKGLGMGLVGGLTSIVTQPIEGASEKGVSVSTSCYVYLRDCIVFLKRIFQHSDSKLNCAS